MTLPKGVSLSPSAGARGDLAGCTDAQFHQADFADPSCPAGSNVGTVTVNTPAVGQLSGSAYLATSVNGHTARLFIDAKSDTFGSQARIKLVGFVDVDPATGATVATFDGLPPVPFTSFTLAMRGGTAPVLAMPRTCGTFQGSAAATPWAGTAAAPTGSLTISQDCPASPAAFAPTLTLTRSSTAAGQSMTFGTTVDVPAGSQALTGLKLSLPAGLLGEISSIPACSLAAGQAGTCPSASSIGTVTAKVGVASAPFTETGKAYLVEGDDTHIARLSIVLPAVVGPIDLGNVVTLADLTLRSDYGLDISTSSIPTQVKGVRLDLDQFSLSIDKPGFMVNPVTCGDANAAATLTADAGGSIDRSQTLTTTGCDALKLDAGLSYGADPASPAVSSAVTTRITAGAPDGSPLDAMKDVSVALPDGVSLSPSAGATGDLAECSAAQFDAADITTDAACPDGSKVGSVSITSPMVGDLSGDVYLGAKSDGDFAGVFFQAKAADYPSLRVKIAGTLQVDPTTGNLTAAFDDLPQVQVSAIALTMRGGAAPVLSLPRTCGDFASTATIVRHGGGTSAASGKLTLDQDCPDPNAFSPALSLGMATTQAGANTSLTTDISIPARQQELQSLALAMPRGLLGRLTVVPQCPLAQAAAGTCDASSLVGTVRAKVGVASAPYTVNGQVYMTAGSDDAIAGLAFVLPAKVGPIDLGNVVTLAKLKIEGNDLQLKISSDAIPTRVQGIPLSIGDLAITIDKPGVVLNASNCDAGAATATFGSAQGGSATSAAPYQATGCGALNWQPKMDLQFTGAASDLAVKGHPTVTTVITQTEGQGDLRTADVFLPTGVATDLANINARVCASAAIASAGGCAANAQVGSVEITTSTLPEPINAPIYLVRVPGQVLPGLAIRVRDQISFDLVGSVKIVSGRLNVVFDGLPDAPISKMSLAFTGGKTGVLQLGSAICGVAGVSTQTTLTSQHGAQVKSSIPLNCNGQISAAFGTTISSLEGTAASLVVRPTGHRRGFTLVVRNKAGLKTLSLRMPAGFSYTKAAKKAIRLRYTGGGNVSIARTLKGRTISLKITSSTALTRLVLNVPPKAAKFTASSAKKLAKKSAQKAYKATLSITDREGNHVKPKATTTFARK
ncbi:MAG: hypothetical protein REI11_13240 [Patulibacter sp.]|nr:hypothetical protein [Patulibacter sp.]